MPTADTSLIDTTIQLHLLAADLKEASWLEYLTEADTFALETEYLTEADTFALETDARDTKATARDLYEHWLAATDCTLCKTIGVGHTGEHGRTIPAWETVRAALLRVGDTTPAGDVEDLEYHGDLRRVTFTVAGKRYSRGFDELVDRIAR